jgi:flagellar assembly protein FliH
MTGTLKKDQLDYQTADLHGVLTRMGNSNFARDDKAPGASSQGFRSLNWSEMAVKVILPEPEPEPEPEIVVDEVEAEEKDLVGEVSSDVHTQPALNEVGRPEIEAQPEAAQLARKPVTVPDVSTTVVQDEAVLQKMRDDAYAEGFSAGKAMTENEREAELTAQFAAMEQIIAGLGASDLLDTEALSQNINAAVFELASERIGFALEEMPELLNARIERLLDRLAHLSADRILFVAPEDLGLVQLSYRESDSQPRIELRADPALRRGDARLRVGGAEICDILEADEAVIPEPEDEMEIVQEKSC